MGINLNIPGTPKFDESLLPWMNNLATRIQDALKRVNGSYSGTTAQRLALPNAAEGTQFFDNTLNRLYVMKSGVWTSPHPFGVLSRTQLAVNSAAFVAIIYPIITPTVTIEAGRRTRVRASALPFSPTAGASVSVSICDSGGTIANQAYRICQTANASEQTSVEHYFSGLAAGAYTFRLGAYANVSSTLAGGGTGYNFLEVEDVGPV